MANNINSSVPQETPIDMSDKYSNIKLNIADTFNRINNKLDIIILYNFPSGNTGGGSGNNSTGKPNGNGKPRPKNSSNEFSKGFLLGIKRGWNTVVSALKYAGKIISHG